MQTLRLGVLDTWVKPVLYIFKNLSIVIETIFDRKFRLHAKTCFYVGLGKSYWDRLKLVSGKMTVFAGRYRTGLPAGKYHS